MDKKQIIKLLEQRLAAVERHLSMPFHKPFFREYKAQERLLKDLLNKIKLK